VRRVQGRRPRIPPLIAAGVPPEHLRGAGTGRRRFLSLVVAAVVVTADQVTKTWALHLPPTSIGGNPAYGRHVAGTIYFDLTFNLGAAFGLGRGVTPIVEAVVVVLLVTLLIAGRKTSRRTGLVTSIGLGMVVGGAVGNLSDRVFRHHGGAVIDFINVAQVNRHEYWPVFNVADACIVVGAILLAYEYSRHPGPRSLDSAAGAARRDPDV
jgi:signal peptidase II